MRSVNLRLPYPPSVNHMWGANGPRRFIRKPGVEFRNTVCRAVIDSGMELAFTGRLAICIELVMPDRRKRDIDNIQKAVLDALAHAGVYKDDCQIDEIRVRRLHVEPPGCVDVCVTEIEDSNAEQLEVFHGKKRSTKASPPR